MALEKPKDIFIVGAKDPPDPVPANQTMSAYLQYAEKFFDDTVAAVNALEKYFKPVTVVLPSLTANTWTAFPALPANTVGKIINFQILDSSGKDLTWNLDVEPDGTTWKVQSLVAKTNLQFKYFLGA